MSKWYGDCAVMGTLFLKEEGDIEMFEKMLEGVFGEIDYDDYYDKPRIYIKKYDVDCLDTTMNATLKAVTPYLEEAELVFSSHIPGEILTDDFFKFNFKNGVWTKEIGKLIYGKPTVLHIDEKDEEEEMSDYE